MLKITEPTKVTVDKYLHLMPTINSNGRQHALWFGVALNKETIKLLCKTISTNFVSSFANLKNVKINAHKN